VRNLERSGLFEGCHRNALGVDPAHDVLDRPILAGSIEALEDYEHRALAFCVEPVLKLREPLDVGCAPRPGLRFVKSCVICGIAVRQAEAVPGDAEALLEVHLGAKLRSFIASAHAGLTAGNEAIRDDRPSPHARSVRDSESFPTGPQPGRSPYAAGE
jgi:hypothetical protein